jgi:hypothetical protein
MAVEHLASMGSYRSKRQLLASNRTVESIVSAVCSLARDRIGALIVNPRPGTSGPASKWWYLC